jgi:hypothetical protein
MRANHRPRSGPRAREWGACGIALRSGITRADENVSRRDRTNFVPKGLKDSAWGFNPRCLLKGRPRPEGAAEPVPQICKDLPNEPLTTNIFRPFSNSNPLRGCNSDRAQYSKTPLPQPHFSSTRTILMRLVRAGRYVDRFPGLTPRAESLSPFGTNSDRIAIRAAKMQQSNTPTLPYSASHNSRTTTRTRTKRLVSATPTHETTSDR